MTLNERMAAVVIGRNEAAQLPASLSSVQASGLALIYVDSGSSDGSQALARSFGVPVVELDPARPFSAARGRNEGLADIVRRWPGIEYVLFLDGDCVLDPAFPAAAAATLDVHKDCAIVTGHLSEQHPDASIYNRLCAIEWRSPAGRIENFGALGGIMAARIGAISDAGGFDERVIAGEDSELGVRLGLAGKSVIKIDQLMASHDARMSRFAEWWKRSVRAGHCFAQRYALHGRSRFHDCRRELISAVLWGFLVPAAAIALLWPTRGYSILLLAGYVALAFRTYQYYLRSGVAPSDAAIASRFMLYSKFANFIGVVTYLSNRFRGSYRIIEYK